MLVGPVTDDGAHPSRLGRSTHAASTADLPHSVDSEHETFENFEQYLPLDVESGGMTPSPSQPRPVKTAQTALAIVEYLKQSDGATTTSVADHLDMARSTAHRHLQTLHEEGWVTRSDPDGTYQVSLNVFHVGASVREEHPVYQYSKERVEELADRTGEKAWCIVEEGGRGIHLYGASNSPVTTYARVGTRTHLHQHAAGKSILAFRPREEVRAILDEHGLPAITDETLTTADSLFEELDEIESRGFAVNREESFHGLHAVGVPVCDDSGYALGALSISGPAHRLKGDVLVAELPEILLEVANEIEINMSYAADEEDYLDD